MAVAASNTDTEQHLYVTVRDEDENVVLELVKVDPEGMYIRDNGQWVSIDPDAENDRVWDRVIHDVAPEAVEVFDRLLKVEGGATVDKLQQYIVEEEEMSA